MGVNKLTGVPWHVEQLRMEEGDQRRHKSRCEHYVKKNNYCSVAKTRCIGSAHCSYYRESPLKFVDKAAQGSSRPARQKDNTPKKVVTDISRTSIKYKNYCAEFPVGTKVKHVKLGKGTVTAHENGRLIIQLFSGKRIVLVPQMCIERKLLQKM